MVMNMTIKLMKYSGMNTIISWNEPKWGKGITLSQREKESHKIRREKDTSQYIVNRPGNVP